MQVTPTIYFSKPPLQPASCNNRCGGCSIQMQLAAAAAAAAKEIIIAESYHSRKNIEINTHTLS
jgi:hypothetical protein